MTSFGPYLRAERNAQVTSSTAAEARSESAVAINPLDPSNLVGASKKFIDPAVYHFKLAPVWTKDEGRTWHESVLPMKPGWDGMTDPTVAFDDFGHAFLVGEPISFDANLTGHGMVVYRSSDGGETWEQPIQLTTDTSDDKQWVQCDHHGQSPHHGNVYVTWGAGSPLRFARSSDHGATWRGRGTDPPGSTLVSNSFAPDIAISPDGTLHIFWHGDGSTEIQYLRSTDGGDTFEPMRSIATGISSLRGHLPITGGWPHFDHGKFRVVTIVTSCTAPDSSVLVAWADMREGRSRIYYRRSYDNGVTWDGPDSGQPLLPQVSYGDTHCFHPQIVCTGAGTIGCAFYTLGEEQPGQWLIHVRIAPWFDVGTGFWAPTTVTSRPWDPLVDAPKSHGDPNVDFIGEYFGLDAGGTKFALLWTDTRTAVQELFSSIVRVEVQSWIPELVVQILAGVVEDGGGLVIVGGKIVRIPPRGPAISALEALAGLDVARASAAEVAHAMAQAVEHASE